MRKYISVILLGLLFVWLSVLALYKYKEMKNPSPTSSEDGARFDKKSPASGPAEGKPNHF